MSGSEFAAKAAAERSRKARPKDACLITSIPQFDKVTWPPCRVTNECGCDCLTSLMVHVKTARDGITVTRGGPWGHCAATEKGSQKKTPPVTEFARGSRAATGGVAG